MIHLNLIFMKKCADITIWTMNSLKNYANVHLAVTNVKYMKMVMNGAINVMKVYRFQKNGNDAASLIMTRNNLWNMDFKASLLQMLRVS